VTRRHPPSAPPDDFLPHLLQVLRAVASAEQGSLTIGRRAAKTILEACTLEATGSAIADRDEFVERLTRWLMPRDPGLAEQARACMGLDGVYNGTSARVHRMIRLAYARGCRRGAAAAWSAHQPVTLRGALVEETGPSDVARTVLHFLKWDDSPREGRRRALAYCEKVIAGRPNAEADAGDPPPEVTFVPRDQVQALIDEAREDSKCELLSADSREMHKIYASRLEQLLSSDSVPSGPDGEDGEG